MNVYIYFRKFKSIHFTTCTVIYTIVLLIQVVKDSCMPEYDEQFEWVIPLAELHSRQVEVTVATHKGFLAGSPVIGQVKNSYLFYHQRGYIMKNKFVYLLI